MLDVLPLVDVGSDTQALAARLISAHTMPQKVAADALHPAAAAIARVKCLLPLNCRHIENAHELLRICQILRDEAIDRKTE